MSSPLEVKATDIVLSELPEQCAFIEHMEGCSFLQSEDFLRICIELQRKDYCPKFDFVPSLIENPSFIKILSSYIDPLDFKYALLKNEWDSLLIDKICDIEKQVAKQILEKITFKVHLLALNKDAKPSDQLSQFLFTSPFFGADVKSALVSLKQNRFYFDEGIILCSKFGNTDFRIYWEELLNELERFPKKGFKRLIGLVCSIGAFEKRLLPELDWLILEGILDGRSTPDIQENVHKQPGLKSYSIQTTPLIRSLELLRLCSEEKNGRRKIYSFSRSFKEYLKIIMFKSLNK